MPSDTKVCPLCAERIEAAAARCRYCHSDLPAPREQPAPETRGDREVLAREPKGSRGPLWMAAGVLVALLVGYGAILVVSSLRPQQSPEGFNVFGRVQNACEEDDGNVVTTDPHGTPMAFATPDGPERFWCVSRQYLTSIGHGPQDALPPVSEVPAAFKWRWPSTTYGE